MLVCEKFEGDGDKPAMDAQHDVYHEALGILAGTCRRSWLSAARLLGRDDAFLGRLELAARFDHRTLQNAHDHLAAYWRWRTGRRQARLPGMIDAASDLQAQWLGWLQEEIGAWPAERQETLRAVCRILAYQNCPQGYAAEDRLDFLLHRDYPLPGRAWRPPRPPENRQDA